MVCILSSRYRRNPCGGGSHRSQSHVAVRCIELWTLTARNTCPWTDVERTQDEWSSKNLRLHKDLLCSWICPIVAAEHRAQGYFAQCLLEQRTFSEGYGTGFATCRISERSDTEAWAKTPPLIPERSGGVVALGPKFLVFLFVRQPSARTRQASNAVQGVCYNPLPSAAARRRHRRRTGPMFRKSLVCMATYTHNTPHNQTTPNTILRCRLFPSARRRGVPTCRTVHPVTRGRKLGSDRP